ncbi:MAG: serine hydroxymethyltransferase [Rickettsiales bacterium]|jgi:glycine hydroxymethyltransferase|nr:serine hydroxymethyltransferase [Rickettsiales bacterium]
MTNFFHDHLDIADPAVADMIARELSRQQNQIELIASENIVSRAVLDAMGSVLTNKYAEGYPGRRYYQGCAVVDEVESLAISRACEIFGAGFANVQPHSGANANLAVLFALAAAGDTILGMSLDAGGHLTHGAKPTISGKWFNAVQYGLTPSGIIDYDAVATLAAAHKPRVIIAGGSAYPRTIDFARFREIADSVGAYLMVDMAHFAGLVAAKLIPSPIGIADVVTATTHKTLRGPRGGLILTNDAELAKKIDRAVFPGTQGGPLENVIAAKAVAFGEILQPSWRGYAESVMKNIRVLGDTLTANGFDLVSGGTDTHLILVDLRRAGITGAQADMALEFAGITCNKNGIPNDPLPPTQTSGIRLGSPAVTTRGFGENEMRTVGEMITRVITAYRDTGEYDNETARAVRDEVRTLCAKFPIY